MSGTSLGTGPALPWWSPTTRITQAKDEGK